MSNMSNEGWTEKFLKCCCGFTFIAIAIFILVVSVRIVLLGFN